MSTINSSQLTNKPLRSKRFQLVVVLHQPLDFWEIWIQTAACLAIIRPTN